MIVPVSGPTETLTPAYALSPGLPGARESMRAPLLPRDGRYRLRGRAGVGSKSGSELST
jgi:hypothetical protein